MAAKTATMTTDPKENRLKEVDMEGLAELLSTLPDDVMLEILVEAGMLNSADRGDADG